MLILLNIDNYLYFRTTLLLVSISGSKRIKTSYIMADNNVVGPFSWDELLQTPAILYPRCAPENCYWVSELLDKWRRVYPTDETPKQGVSSISYGSLLTLASYAANVLRKQLSSDKPNKNSIRIGLAIPEGPFLPLFVLAIHALNATGSESSHPNSIYNSGDKCKDVVLIPMETDEAPERLKHILVDSDPDVILVASGKDTENLVDLIDQDSCIELVDYTSIVQEALLLKNQHVSDGNMFLDMVYPPGIRGTMMDSLRYSHAINGCWDVAKLVAWGCLRIDNMLEDISAADEQSAAASINVFKHSTFEGDILSHIVYTSGTTGLYLS